jgi:hypothetical protein
MSIAPCHKKVGDPVWGQQVPFPAPRRHPHSGLSKPVLNLLSGIDLMLDPNYGNCKHNAAYHEWQSDNDRQFVLFVRYCTVL